MTQPNDNMVLRARDFWGAVVLCAGSLFFLYQTLNIPMWGKNRAGVSGINWYESAAIVPLFIFGALLGLSLCMLAIAIRDGGAARALSSVGLGWDAQEVWRTATMVVILAAYIVGLVPRVDFILASGLLITALVHGYHSGSLRKMGVSASIVLVAALYALVVHFPRSEWSKPHDDDWVTLLAWFILLVIARIQDRQSRVIRALPILSVLVPMVLVSAMAFGFRQNIPNRGGLIFSQIEYHYYVTLKPVWSR